MQEYPSHPPLIGSATAVATGRNRAIPAAKPPIAKSDLKTGGGGDGGRGSNSTSSIIIRISGGTASGGIESEVWNARAKRKTTIIAKV
jgi:hypothetical protein